MVQRFPSVDPMAESYTPWSPYNYVMGNPIRNIDPDGRHVEPVVEKGAGKDGRDLVTIRVTGKLINFSNNNVNMEQALADMKSYIEGSFQGEDINGVDIKMEFNFSIAKTMEDVSESDHLIVLAESKGSLPGQPNSFVPGASNAIGGKVAAVDADFFTGLYDTYIGTEGERTTAHELGHLLGLEHTTKSSNLMTQGRAEFRGNEVTKNQLNSIHASAKGSSYAREINLGKNYDTRGNPNLGIGGRIMRLTNTKGRRRKYRIP